MGTRHPAPGTRHPAPSTQRQWHSAINGAAAEDIYGSTRWLDLVQTADAVEVRHVRRDQDRPETKQIRVLELIP